MRGAFLAILAIASCAFETEPTVVRPTDCTGLADGTLCNDRSLCTSGDHCAAGACVGEHSIACAPSDSCHAEGTCDPSTGLCSDPIAPDGTRCDDADLCTRADACLAGSCSGVAIECAPSDDCHLAGTCDPSTGLCSDPIAPDGTRCEDGELCTTGERCSAGACGVGAPIDCEETQCIAGVCDPLTGICAGAPLEDGTPCNDQSACTVADTCIGGACSGDPLPCETADPCMSASCDAELGCSIVGRANGDPCDDSNACTEGETCTDGACGGGGTVSCDAPDGCHLFGVCDPSIGCVNPTRPDGSLCNDGDLCTFADTCTGGSCDGIPIICNAANECHLAGVCDPANGICSNPVRPDGESCDDDNACTGTDLCDRGTCVGTDPVLFTGTRCQDGICFTDVAVASGITFTSTDSGTVMIGAAGSFLDYDGDGWLDVLLGSESTRPTLYRNLGNGSFSDVTVQANLPRFFLPDRFMGFAVADYDNDGDPDIYLVAWGPNILMRNEGDGTFTDVTQSAGVGDPSWSTAAAFGDYDSDGDLDLYVGNYIAVSNFPFHTPYPNRLYRNEGNGTFTDVTAQLGVAGAGTTLAVTWSDYDGDRDVDLFVCNDFGQTIEPNRVYRNDGGTFTEVAASLGADVQIYCMGIAPGDYDRDGDLDYYFTNIDRNAFLENRGAAGFSDVTIRTQTGIEHDPCYTTLYSTSWGTGFADFDQDGLLDLYVSTGFILVASHIANAFATPKVVFKNDGSNAFDDIRQSAGVDDTRIGRGVAFGDFDNDGDVDILQVNLSGAPRLFRNDSPSPGNRLGVEVIGRDSSRDAVGTRVIAETGSVQLIREINANYSFESSSEKTARFGLGAALWVDRLRLRYPSGADQTLFDLPANMTVVVVEPRVVLAQTNVSPSTVAAGANVNLSFTLRNRSSAAISVDWSVLIGTQAGPMGAISVPANGTRIVTASFAAPGASGTVPLFVTIGDAANAVDQSRVSLTVQ